MTTIAYDGLNVVADRYWTTCYGDKLFEADGKIIGYTGPAVYYSRVVEYFTGGVEPPDLGDEAEVIVIERKTGRVWLYDNEMDSIETEAPVAIGTGYQIAMGFMLGGGDAEGAVRAAAEFDPFTKMGGGITHYKLRG